MPTNESTLDWWAMPTLRGECEGEVFMSADGEDQLEWRDTYFVVFQQADRPTVTQVEAAITESSKRLKLENLQGDEDGMFESVLVQAPQDNAAVEISYERGEAVAEQCLELARQMKDDLSPKQLKKVLKADARLDVMLFERVHDDFADGGDEDDWETTALDPSSLLNVVSALAKLTGGLPIDPASGAVLS